MKQNKKGIEMSMNTVIIAVLALLVLGILIFILSRNTGGLNKGISCPSYQGKCSLTCDLTSRITYIGRDMCADNQYCCSLIPGKGKVIEEVAGEIEVTALG